MTGHRDRADVKAKELRSEVRYCALLLSGLDRGGMIGDIRVLVSCSIVSA